MSNEVLHGVTSEKNSMRSQRRVSRRYGGHLSHKVTEKIIRYATLIEQGELTLKDISLDIKPYVKRELDKILKKGSSK